MKFLWESIYRFERISSIQARFFIRDLNYHDTYFCEETKRYWLEIVKEF